MGGQMTYQPYYPFVLWAVPRFRRTSGDMPVQRSGVPQSANSIPAPANAEADRRLES
jgi:hypothetical protein